MLRATLAYAEDGVVIAMQPVFVRNDAQGRPRIVDVEAHELAGGELTDLWRIEQAQNAIPGQPPPKGWRVCEGDDGSGHNSADGLGGPCAGGEWRRTAKGSKTWPEWSGGFVHQFRVELEGEPGRKRIKALIHMKSGHRRLRASVDKEIDKRLTKSRKAAEVQVKSLKSAAEKDVVIEPDPVDITDVTGSPQNPLVLDADGRTVGLASDAAVDLPKVPLIDATVTEEGTSD